MAHLRITTECTIHAICHRQITGILPVTFFPLNLKLLHVHDFFIINLQHLKKTGEADVTCLEISVICSICGTKYM